ncbi:MAG: M20/M25/M40 family metallo-hydrolase [Gammaproteobacteria bacterium]|nr:M20/M25/M40 family metallo-hydrolase [Gammaproteobacteria bacterium]
MKIEHRRLHRLLVLSFALLVVATSSVTSHVHAAPSIHHELNVTMEPERSTIAVEDLITLPDEWIGNGSFEFMLHAALSIESSSATIEPLQKVPGNENNQGLAPFKRYRVNMAAGTSGASSIKLTYSGHINHPISADGEQYARGFNETPGLISNQGIFLANTTLWYPLIEGTLVNFSLDISLPAGWTAVSQGARQRNVMESGRQLVRWVEKAPQDDIYVVANRFTEYSQNMGTVQAMVFLHRPDSALAQKYLDVTAQYIAMYSKLLGPYPYAKFALVENFWDTGYGMPSFTLLGPRVIRFPFILHSSYPHEILHNWWGNGVFVDYKQGNWAEGLTTYLADHLVTEQRGTGAAYRRGILQKYSDFVNEGRDFALTEFRSRHSSATEAVGYGKTLMLFHMLRQQLGDRNFVQALRRLYRQYKFSVATFGDVEHIFNSVATSNPATASGPITKSDLAQFFQQWVKQAGAPSLRIKSADATQTVDGYHLSAVIEQTQKQAPYTLTVPLVIHLQGQKKTVQQTLTMTDKKALLELNLATRPWLLEVDPEFDLFRRLDSREIPSALSQGFGAEQVLVVLPSRADKPLLQAYQRMAEMWRNTQPGQWRIVLDSDIKSLPADRTIWLLGWNNSFAPRMKQALTKQRVELSANYAQLNNKTYPRDNHSFLFTARHPDSSDSTLLWLATNDSAALPGLTRKLPHYRKYSYLVFEGSAPTNIEKGQWAVLNSPMSIVITQHDGASIQGERGEKVHRQPLAELPPVFSENAMMQDIQVLAGDEMQGRGLGTVQLDRAADYIAESFKAAGLEPGGDNGSYFQTWSDDVGAPLGKINMRNVIALLPGTNPALNDQSVIISAHYDHLGLGWPDVHKGDEGQIHHGADDNASGVAVMLELARRVAKKWRPQRTIVFAAFSAEEAGLLGSAHYIKAMQRYPAVKAMAVVNLDTVGRLGDRPVTIFGAGSATEWVHIFRGAGFVTGIKTNSISTDFGFSDQKSFYNIGVPGIQLFGSVHGDFHRPADSIDKIDRAGLVKIAAILKEATEYLANREEPLTVTLPNHAPQTEKGRHKKSTKGRRVSIGTIPDFTYSGSGVRITGTIAGSPARKAGLKEGDILTGLDSNTLQDLSHYARLLRALKPGDRVVMHYSRGEVNDEVTLTVAER